MSRIRVERSNRIMDMLSFELVLYLDILPRTFEVVEH